ncbi:hypothetical protein FPF71_07045 [Algibacter amylolyticus]|uniref:Uncharacterized protein n=1 Tax=Algibacter amylolyticus TaxID=1608400 RepID=A0A5M7B8E8_9FLAO|nr:hypothetical protein [Algibacter amylolyticus]KAA5825659.1 hypothetical protein F2B50_07045 [Algibacter amylolyticus]MBB5268111.1 hypothetical protein [Algibacter amylolyticus]TSJ79957.1 hypothetical protein FPF71_07045 [Algibacter amylolyticus]
MLFYILTTIFVIIVILIALMAKRFLYVNEHEASIKKELKTFNDNFENIKNIEVNLDYKMGTDHIYKQK